jgi:O-antigen/teichoic acid export membrane protein
MSAANLGSHLTSGRLLARNTIWNFLGQILPMAVGISAIPLLIRGMGVARFGVLSLAWVVIGYFSLFDLGMGRALTKIVADRLGRNDEHFIPPLVWTSLLSMLLLGVFGGLVTLTISPWLVHRALKIPEALQTETLRGFYLLAASIPIVTTTSGLRGILEAQQRFRTLNLIRIPMSIFSFAGPLLALHFSPSLVPVIGILIGGRLIGCGAHVFACLQAMPALRRKFILQRSMIVPVLRFGGWMTVTNLVGPIMIYLDRFLIGTLLSLSAVAYYTAPFDVVCRLLMIPGAVVGVLFPAFALSLMQDPNRIGLLLRRGVKYIFLAIFPIVLVIITLAPEILRLWLGATFAENGGLVLRWLAVGVFVNCLALMPFTFIQAAGRPDINAKLHLAELPIYLATIWVLTKRLGIEGAAIAWTGRVTLDALLLFLLSLRFLPRKEHFLLKQLGISVAVAVSVFYLATLPVGLAFKGAFLLCGLIGFAFLSWLLALEPVEKSILLCHHSVLAVADSPAAMSEASRSDEI